MEDKELNNHFKHKWSILMLDVMNIMEEMCFTSITETFMYLEECANAEDEDKQIPIKTKEDLRKAITDYERIKE